MIKIKTLTTIEEFETIKKGDILIVEWYHDSYKGNKRTRFASYDVVENKTHAGYPEIILQTKNNVYFNYKMFCTGEGSNAKSITLVEQGE